MRSRDQAAPGLGLRQGKVGYIAHEGAGRGAPDVARQEGGQRVRHDEHRDDRAALREQRACRARRAASPRYLHNGLPVTPLRVAGLWRRGAHAAARAAGSARAGGRPRALTKPLRCDLMARGPRIKAQGCSRTRDGDQDDGQRQQRQLHARAQQRREQLQAPRRPEHVAMHQLPAALLAHVALQRLQVKHGWSPLYTGLGEWIPQCHAPAPEDKACEMPIVYRAR